MSEQGDWRYVGERGEPVFEEGWRNYPPGTNDADIERAFGDGEPPVTPSPFPATGRLWESPDDDREIGGDGRYVVALVLGDGVPSEVARRTTLAAARLRRSLVARSQARRGHRRFAVVVWDSEDPERGDLSTSGEEEGEV